MWSTQETQAKLASYTDARDQGKTELDRRKQRAVAPLETSAELFVYIEYIRLRLVLILCIVLEGFRR